MKKTIVNIMFSTSASLLFLAVFYTFINEREILIRTVFEIFGANIVINIGIFLRNKFEINNVFLEFFVGVTYMIIILVIFWKIFNWQEGVPLWFIFVGAVIIYILTTITTIAKISKETKEINELLQQQREKK